MGFAAAEWEGLTRASHNFLRRVGHISAARVIAARVPHKVATRVKPIIWTPIAGLWMTLWRTSQTARERLRVSNRAALCVSESESLCPKQLEGRPPKENGSKPIDRATPKLRSD